MFFIKQCILPHTIVLNIVTKYDVIFSLSCGPPRGLGNRVFTSGKLGNKGVQGKNKGNFGEQGALENTILNLGTMETGTPPPPQEGLYNSYIVALTISQSIISQLTKANVSEPRQKTHTLGIFTPTIFLHPLFAASWPLIVNIWLNDLKQYLHWDLDKLTFSMQTLTFSPFFYMWKGCLHVGKQQRPRRACTSTQPGQSLCCLLTL